MNNKLEKLRLKIDVTDKIIISALARRLELVNLVAEFKKVNSLKPLDKKRWRQVLKNRKLIGTSLGLSPRFVKKIFEEIHQEALKIESRIIKQ